LDQVVDVEALALHRDVAHGVCRGSSNDCDVDGDCLVNQVFLSQYLHRAIEMRHI
jgi:hypothetical protein